MRETIHIYCRNDGTYHSVQLGATLSELSEKICTEVSDPKTGQKFPVLAALVDHKLKELSYSIVYSHEVEFIGFNHADGRRCYIRSLSFVLQNAARALFPDKVLVIDHSLQDGLYCGIVEARLGEDGRTVTYRLSEEELSALRSKMRSLVQADLPFRKVKMPAEEAEQLFEENHQHFKAELLKSLGKFICNVYYLDGNPDTFHGPLVPSTGYLKTFGLKRFGDGFCLQYPSAEDYGRIVPAGDQSKLAELLKEYSDWCQTTGILGVGTLNQAILDGHAVSLINLSEALHERKYAEIADKIQASGAKIIFIAGPSSSGKTSSSLRIAQQCKVLGLNPKVIELDNYFVSREETPRDEDGQYDYEALEAMDLKLLNSQLSGLLAGKAVEIPRYDFKEGRKFFEGNMLQLSERDILIMEGIHALDPAMVPDIDSARIFRVYASALTSLNVDENNNISTTDNRLLRRMIRDNRVRHITPETTILRWPSVRRGENRHIFPFQENADAQFNSALMYELPMLKYFAEPLLRRIAPNSPAYPEAVRLLKFLSYIIALDPSDIAAIPPTSILREFIGGQTLL